MKALKDYIIAEKLHLKEYEAAPDKVTIELPEYNRDENEWGKGIWKKITVPYCKWLIFKDPYRGDQLHFDSFGDFLLGYTWYQSDYEGFDPSKGIVYTSNDFKDAFDWYVNELTSKNMLIKTGKNKYKCKSGTADHDEFFTKVASGEWGEEEIGMDIIHPEPSTLKDFPAWAKTFW